MLLTREQDDLPDLDEPEDWGGTWPIIVAAVIKIVSRGHESNLCTSPYGLVACVLLRGKYGLYSCGER